MPERALSLLCIFAGFRDPPIRFYYFIQFEWNSSAEISDSRILDFGIRKRCVHTLRRPHLLNCMKDRKLIDGSDPINVLPLFPPKAQQQIRRKGGVQNDPLINNST